MSYCQECADLTRKLAESEAACAELRFALGHVATTAKRQLSQSGPDTDALTTISLIAQKAHDSSSAGAEMLARLAELEKDRARLAFLIENEWAVCRQGTQYWLESTPNSDRNYVQEGAYSSPGEAIDAAMAATSKGEKPDG